MDLYEELKAKKIGGAASGGFTPTEQQLAAMNSGITAEDVEQIVTNKTNILSIQQEIGDINTVLEEVL